jgi:hypothetical protein
MDDKVAVILEDPLGVFVPLDADRQLAPVFQPEVDFVTDRLILPAVVARANQKIVGEGGDLAEIENDNVLGLLGLGRPNCSKPVIFSILRGLVRLPVARRLFG